MNPKLRARLLAPILLLVVAFLYWPGLSGDFIFDDFPNIVANDKVQPERLDLESLATAARGYDGPIDRPLATITLALDYLAHGKDPRGYKLTSLAVHLLNSLLVFLLLRRLLPLAGDKTNLPSSDLAAACLALAWAIHPLQVSSVLYVVQRMETMAVSFVLLGLLAYVRGRTNQARGLTGWPWIAAAATAAMAGLLCKETAILFPAFTLALELSLLGFRAADARTGRRLALAYGVALLFAMLVYVAWVLPQYLPEGSLVGRDFNAVERLLSQLRVLPLYLSWMLVPSPDALVFYRDDFEASRGLLSPLSTLGGAMLLSALAAVALALRRRLPLFSLGIFWFFGAHALTSNVFNLELVFEHRNYFALLGIVLASAEILRGALARWPVPGAMLAAALLVALSGLTLARTATWGNPLQLAMEHAARNPMSQRASNDLATIYGGLSGEDAKSSFYAKAMAEFERGSRLPRASALSEQGLILLAAAAGQPADPAWWDRLIDKLRNNALSAQERSAISNLVKQRSEGLALDDARLREAFLVLLEREGLAPENYVQFGNTALVQMKDPELADRAYDRALEASGRDPAFAASIVTGLVSRGGAEPARRFLARAEHQGVIDAGRFTITFEDLPAQADPP